MEAVGGGAGHGGARGGATFDACIRFLNEDPWERLRVFRKLLPNSRLLSSDNWGHTAYGVSACSTAAVDAYLIDGRLPDEGTVCRDGHQPFEG